jgi:hypothetical protein
VEVLMLPVLTILLAAAAAAGVHAYLVNRTWVDRLTRRQVVVHMTDGQSFRGGLAHVYRDALILEPAFLLREDGKALPVDGGAVLVRDRVAWLQTLGGDL